MFLFNPPQTMKKLFLQTTFVATCAIALQAVAWGHGGTYMGPGDTVPPGAGGEGGSGPTPPGGNGPSGPGPGGPSTPSPRGPGAPGGPGAGPGGPSTGGGSGSKDFTLWQYWWNFNKDPYLNLKSHIHGSATQTGSDDYFLGHGTQPNVKQTSKPSESIIRGTIVPALKHSLATERNNDIITGALIALAKIGAPLAENGSSEFEQLIVPFLGSSSQEIAETAAVALGILGNVQSVDTLKSLLNDDAVGRQLVDSEAGVNDRTRAFAAYGLGQVGFHTGAPEVRQGIVDLLWQVCESPRQSTRDVKIAAIIAMGLVPLERGVPTTPLGNSSEAAPETLQEQIDYLIEFFLADRAKNKHFLVRAHAARSICKLMKGLDDDELKWRVVKALAPYVASRKQVGERELRQSATLAFGMLGDLDGDAADKNIRAKLIQASGDADRQVKYFSLIALGQVGGRPGTGETPLEGVAEVRKFLQTQLVRGRNQAKPWAGLAIGLMERGQSTNPGGRRSNASLRALRTSLKGTRTKLEVGAYAIACGIAGDTDAEQLLLEKLDTMSDDDVRGHLAIGLGLMGSRNSIDSIRKVVESSKYRGDLLRQAAIALGLLGDKQLAGNLVQMLAEAKTVTTQAAIGSALGFIGDKRSVAPLVAMLQDTSVTAAARGFAAVALGIVAEREPLPWNAKFSVDINYRASTASLTGGGTGLLDIL